MRLLNLILVVLLPYFTSAHASEGCDQESVVFTCDLENKVGSLKACFNQAENSMYFVVDENGLKTVYAARQGRV